jgi:hypothetical protein
VLRSRCAATHRRSDAGLRPARLERSRPHQGVPRERSFRCARALRDALESHARGRPVLAGPRTTALGSRASSSSRIAEAARQQCPLPSLKRSPRCADEPLEIVPCGPDPHVDVLRRSRRRVEVVRDPPMIKNSTLCWFKNAKKSAKSLFTIRPHAQESNVRRGSRDDQRFRVLGQLAPCGCSILGLCQTPRVATAATRVAPPLVRPGPCPGSAFGSPGHGQMAPLRSRHA